MNKKELASVVALILLIPLWLFIDARFIKPRFPDPPPAATPSPAETSAENADGAPASASSIDTSSIDTSADSPVPSSPEATDPPLATVRPAPDAEVVIERLANQMIGLQVSNRGGVVESVTLFEYPESLEEKEAENGEAVKLDFATSAHPPLLLEIPGFPARTVFETERMEGADGVRYQTEVQPGLVLQRELVLTDGYVLEVADRWVNRTELEMRVPEHTIALGPMFPRPEASQKFGPYVGVDARHLSSGVTHYVKKLAKGVKNANGVFRMTAEEGLYWFTVKNKFFTQILTLELGDWLSADALVMRAVAGEGDVKVGMAQASARLMAVDLAPGAVAERRYRYYVGPMTMGNLRELGGKQEEMIDVRLFRIFDPLVALMTTALTTLHGFVGNWGLAIILLTFVVRMLFWPLTQKGAENMKKMSELSPQMKELREKYKNNPQKLNAEMSAFYKQNKVNPMAGCLPMLVQIPVFISLYGTLRVAVDLRFAEFLWIQDLSEQEALFFIAGFPVNILPLTMGATMVLQQKLTPSNMDEQQKKIMMMMPIVFLFITYTMPSGLLLYWTTSNLISIYQTTHTRRRDAKRDAARNADGSATTAAKAKPAKNAKTSKPRRGKK